MTPAIVARSPISSGSFELAGWPLESALAIASVVELVPEASTDGLIVEDFDVRLFAATTRTSVPIGVSAVLFAKPQFRSAVAACSVGS